MTSDYVNLQRGGVGPRAGVAQVWGVSSFHVGRIKVKVAAVLLVLDKLGVVDMGEVVAVFLVVLDRLGVVVLAAVELDVVDSVLLVLEEL